MERAIEVLKEHLTNKEWTEFYDNLRSDDGADFLDLIEEYVTQELVPEKYSQDSFEQDAEAY